MVLRDARWDRKESPKSNLHVCDKDDTKIVIYSPEECIEKKGEKKKLLYNLCLEENDTKQRT